MISDSERRTALYRFYDTRETLLYVGITNDPWRRWRQHVAQKPWYPQVKHQAITWYDTEPQARKAEKRPIRTEAPAFNIAGAVRPPQPRLLRFRPAPSVFTVWTCFWVVFPFSLLPAESFWPILRLITVPLLLSTPIPALATLLLWSTPCIHRLGCWLDRNYGTIPKTGKRRILA